MNHYGLKLKVKKMNNVYEAYKSVVSNKSDVCLNPVGTSSSKNSLLPHFKTDYAIYYKINEFHVSSTLIVSTKECFSQNEFNRCALIIVLNKLETSLSVDVLIYCDSVDL